MSQKKKRSLASEIAELLTPTPKDFDPEDESVFSEKPKTIDRFEVDEEENNYGNVNNKNLEQKLALRGDIDFTDGKYAGKPSSRKHFFGNEEDEDEGEDEVEDDNQEVDEDEEEESSEEEEDGEDGEEEEEEEEEDSDDSDDEEDEEEGMIEAKYGDFEKYEKELNEIEKVKEKQSIQLLSQSQNEKEKAQHTKNQKHVWNNLLKLRIKQQKMLNIGNRLPLYDLYPIFNETPKIQTLNKEVAESLKENINDMLDLSNTFKLNNPQTQNYAFNKNVQSSSASQKSQKRSRYQWECEGDHQSSDQLETIWKFIKTQDDAFTPYMEMIVDHWNKKTQLTTRISMLKFKSINRSVFAQVRAIMEDPEKLIKRSQLTKKDQKVIGLPSPLPEYLPEIYDDTSFYQELLKELIEGEAGNEFDMTRSWLSTRDSQKKRKEVDRKASKGRKLRYNIHDKLVNFVAPTEREPASYASDLFLQLFTK